MSERGAWADRAVALLVDSASPASTMTSYTCAHEHCTRNVEVPRWLFRRSGTRRPLIDAGWTWDDDARGWLCPTHSSS